MTAIEKAAQAFVKQFQSDIGYHEKASNAQLQDPTANSGSNNWNKFAAFIDGLRDQGLNFYNGRKNIGPQGEWCDSSYDTEMIWFIMDLGLDAIEAAKLAMKMLYQPSDSCGAGCKFSAGYYRAAGAWIDRGGTPKMGDQFFIGPKYDESHTGAVAKVDSTYIYTVEGNYGNQVAERKIRRDDSSIAGYGRPNFALVAKYFEEPEAPKEEAMTEKQVTDIIDKASVAILDAVDAKIEKAITDALGPMIYNYDEIPWKGVKDEVKEMVDMKVIDGGTDESVNPNDVNMRLQLLRVLVVGKRFSVKATAQAIAEKIKSVFKA